MDQCPKHSMLLRRPPVCQGAGGSKHPGLFAVLAYSHAPGLLGKLKAIRTVCSSGLFASPQFAGGGVSWVTSPFHVLSYSTTFPPFLFYNFCSIKENTAALLSVLNYMELFCSLLRCCMAGSFHSSSGYN